MAFKLDSKIPAGELAQKWSNHKAAIKVVSPANKRKLDIIVVGTGLGGASAAASLGELGYNVKVFCIQDSPRRAHSIAAQGGINAAKNYRNDNDSIYRLFYDTIKGGDYRAREANVYRMAEVSNCIIDQCVGQGVPFAREYGGMLDNRSFGGAQVSRTFYARGQTGQQLLLGAYAALNKEIAAGSVKSYPRHEMLDIVIEDGEARGIIARNLVTGELEHFGAHAVVIASGGYGNVFFLSTNAMASNGSAAFQCYRKGAGFANPCFTQIHPTCIPVHGDQQSKLTLMSESLRNDGRIWVPKKIEDVKALRSGAKKPSDIAEEDRDYYLERRYPAVGNLVPRDVAARAAKERCDAGFGVNETGLAVFLDFKTAIERLGKDVIKQRYGNLFDMYEEITDVNPYEQPMQIFPAVHYTMGGIPITTDGEVYRWADGAVQVVDGLFAAGECSCVSVHGANRLGGNSLLDACLFGTRAGQTMAARIAENPVDSPMADDSADDMLTDAADQAADSRKAELDELLAGPIDDSDDGVPTANPYQLMAQLGSVMEQALAVRCTAQTIDTALTQLNGDITPVADTLRAHDKTAAFNQEVTAIWEVRHLIELAEVMLHASESRQESRGSMQRLDFPERDDEHFLAHSMVADDGSVSFKPVHITDYPPKKREY